MTSARAIACLLVAAGAAGGCSLTGRSATPPSPPPPVHAAAAGGHRLFAVSSFWNRPLGPHARLDPHSAAYVTRLQALIRQYGTYVNTSQYSSTVYIVGPHQPMVRARLRVHSSNGLDHALARIPIPPGAHVSRGHDAQIVIWQPQSDTMWELWHARRAGSGWEADWGGRMQHVSSNPGYFLETRWGATATGLPLIGGLMRIGELQRGRIDHALALSIPRPRMGAYSWPAQRTDGPEADPGAIMEGTRFRLDPRVNVDRLHVPAVVKAIARAAQRYGMVVRDQSATVVLDAETPQSGHPYHAIFGGLAGTQLLRGFPWQHLQVLRTGSNVRVSFYKPPPRLQRGHHVRLQASATNEGQRGRRLVVGLRVITRGVTLSPSWQFATARRGLTYAARVGPRNPTQVVGYVTVNRCPRGGRVRIIAYRGGRPDIHPADDRAVLVLPVTGCPRS